MVWQVIERKGWMPMGSLRRAVCSCSVMPLMRRSRVSAATFCREAGSPLGRLYIAAVEYAARVAGSLVGWAQALGLPSRL